MTVKDLKENMTCTLISAKKDRKFEKKTTIRIIERDTVYVDATIYKGRLVNVNGASNHLVIDVKSTEPQIFQYVYPEIYKRNGKAYYKISLRNKSSVQYNRRHKPRVHVGKSVAVRADNSSDMISCTLKDISAVGFALEFIKRDLPAHFENIKMFRCIFTDADRLHDIKFSAELKGVVKRVVDTAEDKTLFGCQMPYSYKVDKYVSDKEKLKQNRR